LPHNAAAARKWKRHQSFSQHFRIVRRNWTAIAAALELSYGSIQERDQWKPNNRATIGRAVRLVRAAVFYGPHKLKEWAHELRKKACGVNGVRLRNRGKEPKALFLASTLSRALELPRPTKDKVESEVKAARERLEAPSPLPEMALMNELAEFIRKVVKESNMRETERSIPLPGSTACLEQGRKAGGAA
jgi:hypothetical protein